MELDPRFSCEEKSQVMQFLEKYPFLIALLEEMVEQIPLYFATHTALLAMDTDPDTNEEQLVVFISTPLEPKEALEKLDQFIQIWIAPLRNDYFYKLSIHIIGEE